MSSILDDLKNAFSRRNDYLMKIILLNVAVFVVVILFALVEFIFGPNPITSGLSWFLAMPVRFSSFITHPWSLFTYSFYNGADVFGIFFNMLNLYWFGNIIQDFIGHKRLLNIYVLGSLFGAIGTLIAVNTIPAFAAVGINSVLFGSAAAVFSVMFAASTLVPNFEFVLILFGPVKIKWITAVMLLLSLLIVSKGNVVLGMAEVMGALLGFLYIVQLKNGNDLGKPVQKVVESLEGVGVKKTTKMKVTYRDSSFKRNTETEPTQEEVDLLLDKISVSGYESLSKEEKQRLFKASQKLK